MGCVRCFGGCLYPESLLNSPAVAAPATPSNSTAQVRMYPKLAAPVANAWGEAARCIDLWDRLQVATTQRAREAMRADPTQRQNARLRAIGATVGGREGAEPSPRRRQPRELSHAECTPLNPVSTHWVSLFLPPAPPSADAIRAAKERLELVSVFFATGEEKIRRYQVRTMVSPLE